jgi:hypothetical protein
MTKLTRGKETNYSEIQSLIIDIEQFRTVALKQIAKLSFLNSIRTQITFLFERIILRLHNIKSLVYVIIYHISQFE